MRDTATFVNIPDESKGRGRMCHFLEPSNSMELGQNMTYSNGIWHSSCFYEEQYESGKSRRRFRRYCHRPPNLFPFKYTIRPVIFSDGAKSVDFFILFNILSIKGLKGIIIEKKTSLNQNI